MKYKFNNIELDTDGFSLTIDGKIAAVEPQVFNLIVYLINNKSKIISRDEILDDLWPGRIVSDASINNHIKSARKILGDDGVKQQVIKTVHSRGYQFIASIEGEPENTNVIKKPASLKRPYLYVGFFALVLLSVFFIAKFYNSYELNQSVQRIASYQEISYSTFIAQAKRRNELEAMIENRIGDKREMQFEKYFSYYFKELNSQEKFVFDQIRGMTDGALYQNNIKILDELNSYPDLYKLIKGTKELQQHLTFWVNKYHSVFSKRQDMCLLYVGVEDDVPYPVDVNQNIKDWLEKGTK